MGLLDPKVEKERTFELLAKKNAVSAQLDFQGGHDEGSVYKITLFLADGSEIDLPTWYCGGYGIEDSGAGFRYVPLSTPANEDEELADLLEGPINEKFGSWGGVGYTSGCLTWDTSDKTCRLQYETENPVAYDEQF